MSWVNGSHPCKKSLSKKMGACAIQFTIECDFVINLLSLCKFYTLCAILKLVLLRLTRVWYKNHWVEILSSGFLVSFLPRSVVKIAIFNIMHFGQIPSWSKLSKLIQVPVFSCILSTIPGYWGHAPYATT